MIVAIIPLLILSIWVGFDADSRGMNGFGWGIAVFFVLIIALPIYFAVRSPKTELDAQAPDGKLSEQDKTAQMAEERSGDTSNTVA